MRLELKLTKKKYPRFVIMENTNFNRSWKGFRLFGYQYCEGASFKDLFAIFKDTFNTHLCIKLFYFIEFKIPIKNKEVST